MSLSWFDVVGCCGHVKLHVLALLITYINMVVCIIYLVLALVLCILLTTADVAVKKLSTMTSENAIIFILDISNSIKQGYTDELNKKTQIGKGTIPSNFIEDMKYILEGITRGGERNTSSLGRRRPLKKIRSGQGRNTNLSLRDRWELGILGIKRLLTAKLTLSNLKKFALLHEHMLLVATVWSVLLAVHLAFIVVLIIGVNQEIRFLVITYCIFGAVLLSLLLIMFLSHSAICIFPFYYFLHICLYTYSLLVLIAYLAKLKNHYGEEFQEIS